MRRGVVLVAVLVLLALGSGCTTAIKQVYYTASGPQGSFLVEETEAESAFASYTVAEVQLFNNALPSHIDSELVAMCQAETIEELDEAGLFDSVVSAKETSSGALLIRGRLLDYKSGKIPGQRVIGGGDHLIAHVELVDGSSGKVLAWAVVRGVVKSAAQTDEVNFAEGMAKGIKKFIKKVTGREEPEE